MNHKKYKGIITIQDTSVPDEQDDNIHGYKFVAFV